MTNSERIVHGRQRMNPGRVEQRHAAIFGTGEESHIISPIRLMVFMTRKQPVSGAVSMVAVALFVTMVVIMVVSMVCAPFRLPRQLAVQVGLDQRFDRLIRKPGHDVDALLGKECQGSLANAPRDDDFNPLALQPARERPGDMFGRRQRLGAEGCLGRRVHFDQCKVAAAAEMRIQAAVFNRNGDFHDSIVCFVIFR